MKTENRKLPFVYGVQYYRAPTPRRHCWAEDLQTLKNRGYDTVKYWVQWRWSERQEGVCCWDDLDELMELAQKHGRTLLRTPLQTVDLTSNVIDYLNRALAPQITRHGVLMNIYGQGVLMLGDSGIGKSETAIELLKRGHRLVADDAVEIRQVSNSLYGTAPELIRHYVEIRGVGIIEVQKLFGMGAVQFETEIDLVIQLEPWVEGKFYDRLGLGEDSYTMLGVSLPYITIPVRPGRNLAGIVEIATMKNRQMNYGGESAQNFIAQFDQRIDEMVLKARENG